MAPGSALSVQQQQDVAGLATLYRDSVQQTALESVGELVPGLPKVSSFVDEAFNQKVVKLAAHAKSAIKLLKVLGVAL